VVDEEKTNIEQNEAKDVNSKAKSNSLMKYVILAFGIVVVVALASFLTLKFMGNGNEVVETEPVAETPFDSVESEQADMTEDSLLFGDDPSILEKIADNLAFLDYEPDPNEIAEEENRMSTEDSIEAVNWLEQEKSRLAKKEKELNTRQTELEKLDRQVSQKMLKLEQVESTRISNLAKLYDGMESRAVTKLMANLDNETIVAILPRMKTKNASAVLSLMPSKRAAILSKKMITIAEN